MPLIRLGDNNALAGLFKKFLTQRGYSPGEGNVFTQTALAETKRFQQWLIDQPYKSAVGRIKADGVPGNITFGYACALSATDLLHPAAIADAVGVAYPKIAVGMPPPLNGAAQKHLFGEFGFDPTPETGDKEKITIRGGWVAENIVSIQIPQLVGVQGSPTGKVHLHRLIKPQFTALWSAWEKQGIHRKITGFAGMFVPRFVRGSVNNTLSNHSWGAAFDVNVSANYLHYLPAFPGENGCLFDHVPIAQDYGFGWGGHYSSRLDGMHFEARIVLNPNQLKQVNDKYGVT
jgi:hypothetical protein